VKNPLTWVAVRSLLWLSFAMVAGVPVAVLWRVM